MHRWPGQSYEYVENVLFEKGPFGSRSKKGESCQPQSLDAEVSANEKKRLEAEAHFQQVIEKKKSQSKKRVSTRVVNQSNFLSVPRGSTFKEKN